MPYEETYQVAGAARRHDTTYDPIWLIAPAGAQPRGHRQLAFDLRYRMNNLIRIMKGMGPR